MSIKFKQSRLVSTEGAPLGMVLYVCSATDGYQDKRNVYQPIYQNSLKPIALPQTVSGQASGCGINDDQASAVIPGINQIKEF